MYVPRLLQQVAAVPLALEDDGRVRHRVVVRRAQHGLDGRRLPVLHVAGVSAWAVTYVFLGVIESAYARSPLHWSGLLAADGPQRDPAEPYWPTSRALVTAAVASSNQTVRVIVQEAAAPDALWPVYVLG